MTIPHNFFWSLSLLFVLVLSPSVSSADEAESIPQGEEGKTESEGPIHENQPLKKIIVTATQNEKQDYYIPYIVHGNSGLSLVNQKAFRSFPDLFKEVPGISPQKTGHGQGSPFIRGFTSQRTLLLIDGIRLNNAVFREGPNQYWNTIDPLTIDRLEIVKGPSSVLYGSDAIGGTVNVITRSRQPLDSDNENTFHAGTRTYYRYSSAEDSNIGRQEFSGAWGQQLGLLAGISAKDFGNLSGGRHVGEQPNTSYHEIDGDFKGVYRLKPNLDLVVAFQNNHIDGAPRTHSTMFAQSYRGTSVGSDFQRDFRQDRTLGYAQLIWTPEEVDWLNSLKLSLSLHRQKEVEERIRSNSRKRYQGFTDDTYGFFVKMESPSPIGTLSYGLEYYHDEVDSFFQEFNPDGSLRTQRPRGPIADDSSYDLLGIYIQDSIRAHERVEVILGGRFNHIQAQADQVDPDPSTNPVLGELDEEFNAAVGSVRVIFEATDELNLFGGASQGFRAPNLADLTRLDVARSGEVETPSPDLDPEEFINFEIGAKTDIEELHLQAYISYYYTIIDGMIVRFPTGNLIDGDPEVTKDNVGDGFVHGVELGLAWNFYKGFSAFGNFSWLEGKADTFDSSNNKVSDSFSKLQPATGLVGVRWDSEDRKYWIEATAFIANDQSRFSLRDEGDTQRIPPGGTPGYTVYSLRGGVEPKPGLKLFGGIENITDKDYRIHGSGQNEAGTNIIVGLDWAFDQGFK